MVLTATATRSTREKVMTFFAMNDAENIVSVSPEKENITYLVQKFESILVSFIIGPLAEHIRLNQASIGKTIIFCQRVEDCASLYLFFKSYLEDRFTVPNDAPDLPQFRFVDMYTSCVEREIKEQMCTSIASSHSSLRIVIATIAFQMGVDVSNHYSLWIS